MGDPNTQFPFKRHFNLLKLIDFWKESATSGPQPLADQARSVLALLDQTPELLSDDLQPETLVRHRDVLSIVMSPAIPIGHTEKSIVGAIPPYDHTCFHSTESFNSLGILAGLRENVRVGGAVLPVEIRETAYAISAYFEVLRRHYGLDHEWDFSFVVSRPDPVSGLTRHFSLDFDLRFVEVRRIGELKSLSENEMGRLLRSTMDLAPWLEILPPDQFEFDGFVVVTATEVTGQEELSYLKDDLLRPGSLANGERIDILENRLRVILRRPELRLGVIGLVRSEFGAIESARPIGRSLLMSDSIMPSCTNKRQSFYAKAFESNEPVIVSDLQDCKEGCTGFELHLMQLGVNNILIAPLLYEDERVGLLELASPNAGDITSWNAGKLMQVLQLFATALHRELMEHQNRIQAVIKKHYTAIHPAVEWRFRAAAERYLDKYDATGQAEKEEIVFDEVYPLYGLSDIRSSSTHRVESIREDLKLQLQLAVDVVEAAAVTKALPALDELRYQLERLINQVELGLSSGDEVSVLEFLKHEIEGRLEHLGLFGADVKRAIETYQSALDPTLKVVYRARKAYEDSVAAINHAVVAFIESQEDRAQQMFPHYFERYQTDGVDYNIYVGGSLIEDGGFDPLYLRNLRLWQLITTCGIVWEMNALRPTLQVDLETAHLILVQSSPLAIRFREDEKQFDVDGAYNARYEIVKKRIDKATIRGTEQRLTQPGQIAIVYAQEREAAEYRRYLSYLHAAGYIEDDVEELDLDDLQGVSGLKALRVTVMPNSPDVELEVTPEGEMRPVKIPVASN